MHESGNESSEGINKTMTWIANNWSIVFDLIEYKNEESV